MQKLACFVLVMGGVFLMMDSLRAHWGLRKGIGPLRSGIGLIASVVMLIAGLSLLITMPHMTSALDRFGGDIVRWRAEGSYGQLVFFIGIPAIFVLVMCTMLWQGISDLRKWRQQ